MKPIVLIVGEDGFDAAFGGAHYVINKDYADAVCRMGGIPVLAYDVRNAEDYVNYGDALLLTGGPHIHAAWYGGIIRDSNRMSGLSQTRDDLDFTLGRKFMEQKKPILAIGRGMQVVNVLCGGTLCQDVAEKTGQLHKDAAMHSVQKKAHRGYFNQCSGELLVNSFHSQSIERLGAGLQAVYTAEDGTVEGFCHESLPVLGVQWHPERKDWQGKMQNRVLEVFGNLLTASCTPEHDRTKKLEKPVILINGGPALDRQFEESSWVVNKTYPAAVSAAGGIPVMPLTEGMEEAYASIADALILSGSVSFVPRPEVREKLAKDKGKREAFDEKLFWAFYKPNKPVFGICLGHQSINCFLGGTLESTFKLRTGQEHMLHQHTIRVEKESILYPLFGEEFWINSRHNDKVDVLADCLRATSYSKDGVIESYEHRERPIYGVEWHPERMRGDFKEPPEGPDMTKLFQWFMEEVKRIR